MTLKNTFVAALAVLACAASAGGAFAQAGGAPAAPAATPAAAPANPATPARDPKDNWLKVCDPLDGGKEACIMRQIVYGPNGQFFGSFLLKDDPSQESRLIAIAAVPLGVLLPFGLSWQIDSNKPARVPFMLCDPQSCATQLVVNEAYVASLKKGGKLTLTAKSRQNTDFKIEINLAGFTAVYDGKAQMTIQQLNEQTSGSAALEKMLQDRAEELRRQLGATPTATP